MNTIYDVIVIGAGQSGLAAGYYLKKAGLQFLVLESGREATGSWPHYYDSLRLFSPAKYSSLPGYSFPGGKKRYPSRDEVVDYLKTYAEKMKLPIHYQMKVICIHKQEHLFHIETESGKTFLTKNVIAATGSFKRPYMPVINGHQDYQGHILHSSTYKNPDTFNGKSVIVVGRGNSAIQIAVELAPLTKTTLATLHPVQFMPQTVLGRDLHFWLTVTGLDRFPFWRIGVKAGTSTSVIDTGKYKEMISNGLPQQRKMFTSFTSTGVVWADGQVENVDAVIFSTGYHDHVPYLKDLGVLDARHTPLHRAGVSTSVNGLYYLGLTGQRSFASATIRGTGRDAKIIISKIVRQIRNEANANHKNE